ncbi:transcriptional regulator, LacI family [Pseudonocardia sp. Ae168_Ps1]|nr:transcriptional regulator, LacI family [Pseudonocardia sp. Ae168_Ps1]OLL77020.1 transcriptional regulator, LacI family [Pseudonocardia sp. Ae150A_Ps1]OLL88868.1 transcriptional regulator, LacI family [Pseudonocardia sp. Ae263_Ps1]OLL91106.1 transcriptional regulator, LacI family [Pseudonocardia sp. Ae356_Ps1]
MPGHQAPVSTFDTVSTLADVARLAGVGVGTASRAISGKGYVDDATRRRVLDAAGELGYRRNAAARALRERRSLVVGLMLPDIHNEFYTASAAVLQAELADAGYQLLVVATGNSADAERHAWETMLDRQVDGVVHVPVDPGGVAPPGLPVVQLNRHTRTAGTPAVVSDDVAGVAELTRHVIAAGHTDLAVLVGAPELSTSAERLAGFRTAADAAGLAEDGPRGARYRVLVTGFSADGGAAAMARTAGDLPGAVVALSSRLVMGVLRWAGEHEVRIPADLSLAGLGDPEWFAIWQPGITTFAPPLAEMGRRAAHELIAAMGEEPGPAGGTIRLPGELRIRGSVTGAVPARP